MEQYFTSGLYVLVNLAALVCCLVLGPRGPRQLWRYLAAGSFAIGAFGSLLWIIAYLVASDGYSSTISTMFTAVSWTNTLLNIVATALLVWALLNGRPGTGTGAGPAAATGYGAGQQPGYQPGYQSAYAAPGFNPGPSGEPPAYGTSPPDAGYPSPAYGQPASGQPTYGQPTYGPPAYGAPTYGPAGQPPQPEQNPEQDPSTGYHPPR